MKKLVLAMLVSIAGIQASGQNGSVFDEGSTVKFVIRNFGFNVNGSFTGLKGTMRFDPAAPQNASFDVSVDAATVNTGIEMRDDHLRKADYFDVANFPLIRFVSTGVRKNGREWMMTGNLTIKNVTKEISFPFGAIQKETGYVFTGEFKINRRDFKVGGGSLSLSDEVKVSLSILANP